MGLHQASPFLVVRNIAKSFGGAVALRDVSLSFLPGEVHGLAGANGAGKSTLIKILAGLHQPDAGTIEIDGKPAVISTPQQATALGMSFIHQELAFIPGMNVLQNIMLGIEKPSRFGMVDWQAIARTVQPIADQVGIESVLTAPIKSLSTAEKWLANICRALVRKARLIVMDEPTASLSTREAEKLFRIVRDLSASGVAVLYVSHRLAELQDLCARVSVFRDGRSVAELPRGGITRPALVSAIVGQDLAQTQSKQASAAVGGTMLQLRGLTRLPRVRHVSLDLRKGEVLGIGGLVGAGRSELVRLIYGADKPHAGTMSLAGETYAPRTPADAVKAGFGFVPEERRAEGLLLQKSVGFNLNLANLNNLIVSPQFPILKPAAQKSHALASIQSLGIKTRSPATPAGHLSGGNQQKVVIGRWLQRQPQILILDEPTRGVDIGARSEIHRLVRELAAGGMAVLVVSSEPDELPDLCDRVVVMAEGEIVQELAGEGLTRAAIVAASYAAAESQEGRKAG